MERFPLRRLSYIDWMRGLACVLMFQTHCYDAWLYPSLHSTQLYGLSQLGGTLPAPLFLFLAGVSSALVTERMREKGISRNAIAVHGMKRGAEIFALGIVFRLQEYALGFKVAPWTDLLRVDILNMLGLSMILLSALTWLTSSPKLDASASAPAHASVRRSNIFAALVAAALVAMLTPPLWTTHRPRFLPWPLESYINGVHTFNVPQVWLFPLFPWSAFAFTGLAIGFLIFSSYGKQHEARLFGWIALLGAAACGMALALNASPLRLYAVYDFWHTSPNFFLIRCGVMLVILALVYAWCRWGFAQRGFSPVIQYGQTSLLVYWVHIQFVYGMLSILPKKGCGIPKATLGLAIIMAAMLGLSILRTNYKNRKSAATASRRAPAALGDPAAAQ